MAGDGSATAALSLNLVETWKESGGAVKTLASAAATTTMTIASSGYCYTYQASDIEKHIERFSQKSHAVKGSDGKLLKGTINITHAFFLAFQKTRNMTQYFYGFPEDKDQDHSKHPELEDKSTNATMEGVEGKIFDDGFFSQPGKVFYYLY
ncbi:hypothetical protein VPH35_137457 [Triticum aestivum]